ncbi:hypothetical protein JTE90_027079 [Oedothorax gibbosus]|uniref:Uncharacterized protein n=1 Tax=Oedothorax gibbosus TaxID=931172 RepID=A0AAV6UPH2_9ARAC|nr:hypothetical protein JTE90_027079 [Oedothorax gibbosus]
MSHIKFSDQKNSKVSPSILPTLFCLIFLLIFWQIIQSPWIQILKSLTGGILLVYYTWEIIYFDSQVPGIQPTSPLSPSTIRYDSGSTLHMNYYMALIHGAFFALFLNWWT